MEAKKGGLPTLYISSIAVIKGDTRLISNQIYIMFAEKLGSKVHPFSIDAHPYIFKQTVIHPNTWP